MSICRTQKAICRREVQALEAAQDEENTSLDRQGRPWLDGRQPGVQAQPPAQTQPLLAVAGVLREKSVDFPLVLISTEVIEQEPAT